MQFTLIQWKRSAQSNASQCVAVDAQLAKPSEIAWGKWFVNNGCQKFDWLLLNCHKETTAYPFICLPVMKFIRDRFTQRATECKDAIDCLFWLFWEEYPQYKIA